MNSSFNTTMVRRFTEVAVMALCYFVAGKFSGILTTSPVSPSPVFPAAGFALAGVLLFGYRLSIGVFIGSFLLFFLNASSAEATSSLAKSLTLGTSVGAGAAAQACMGALLVRRFGNYPNPLVRESDVISLLVLGGPIACVINSSIGVTTLLLTDAIPPASYPATWWTWWVGETIGVLIFAPLILIWSSKPRKVWLRRQVVVSVPMMATFAAVVALFLYASRWERAAQKAEFEERSEDLSYVIKKTFDGYMEVLHSLDSLYASSSNVERHEFGQFVKRSLQRHEGIQALAWAPRVSDSERSRFEARARREGITGFQIRERSADGTLVPATERAEYYPIAYVEPMANNRDALGFDNFSEAARIAAAERACNTGKPAATDRVVLVQERENQFGFLVFIPVYAADASRDTVEERQAALKGFLSGAFRINDMMASALRNVDLSGMCVHLHDEIGGHTKPLYSMPHRSHADAHRAELAITVPFDIGGHVWHVTFSPAQGESIWTQSWQAWGVLAGGLLLTGLLGAFLLVVTGNAAQLLAVNQALRESEERLARTEEFSLVMVTHVNLKGHWLKVPPTLCKLLGYSEAEMLAQSCRDLIHPDDFEGCWSQCERLIRGELKTVDLELRLLRKDNATIWVYTNCSVVTDTEGKPLYLLTYIRDITEKKRLEAQFLRAQRMESIGRLASGIAHDLNNILTPILMSVPMFRLELTPREMEEVLATVERSARRGADVVNQLLTFGRGVSGNRAIMLPRHQVKEITKLVRETFPKNLTVSARVCEDVWPVTADATQIHQVLLNLCVNARDAMPEGGVLSIVAENVHIDEARARESHLAQPGNYLVFRVSDTGQGIRPEIMDNIFDPFFTTKPLGHGTGLGLFTVLGIVKSHGGFVNVTSTVGQGTTFEVYLPAATEAKPGAASAQAPPPPKGHGEWILVVDDETSIRGVISKALQSYGYRPLTARDGKEGLSMFEQHRHQIRLVLTDVMMPSRDGVGLIQDVRLLKPRIPVIALSGAANNNKELGSLGIKTFLAKPFTAETLLWAVAESLSPSEIETTE